MECVSGITSSCTSLLSQLRPWQQSPDNNARGVVIWPEPEIMDITVTLYKVHCTRIVQCVHVHVPEQLVYVLVPEQLVHVHMPEQLVLVHVQCTTYDMQCLLTLM